ncbi:MAG: hypothetical protein L0Z50_13340 [Verrucomicrobiales bacterium]|nr:hypothetical protein [Verrucomicrobiales bacterium]
MKVKLDPFRAIVGAIEGYGDADILSVVAHSAGLRFDETLSQSQASSHRTRIRELNPRALAAYDSLPEAARVVAARAAIANLVGRAAPVRQPAVEALARIGWQVQDEELIATTPELREMFFPKGSQWDAFVVLRGLFAEAATELFVVDAYANETLFELLAPRAAPLSLRVLCSKRAHALAAEATRFAAQFTGVVCEVRGAHDFHDRFVILDGQSCVHVGASINHAGRTAFMISRIDDDSNKQALLRAINAAWQAATTVH